MYDLAQHIIKLANQHNLSITNWKLQLVLYFGFKAIIQSQKFNTTQIQRLYRTPFYVWRYGPIEPKLYDQYKCFGPDPFTKASATGKIDPRFNAFNAILLKLLQTPRQQLVQASHQNAFWQSHIIDVHGWRSDFAYPLNQI